MISLLLNFNPNQIKVVIMSQKEVNQGIRISCYSIFIQRKEEEPQ